MPDSCDLLFVYGTLLQKDNEFAKYLMGNSRFIIHGKFKGVLYDLGEYPAAVSRSFGSEYVYGSILQLHKAQEILGVIDDYEGVGLAQLQPNEYFREIVSVETETGMLQSWVYLYQLPVDNLIKIEGGDYLKYLQKKSRQA